MTSVNTLDKYAMAVDPYTKGISCLTLRSTKENTKMHEGTFNAEKESKVQSDSFIKIWSEI